MTLSKSEKKRMAQLYFSVMPKERQQALIDQFGSKKAAVQILFTSAELLEKALAESLLAEKAGVNNA